MVIFCSLFVAGQDAALYRGADADYLVGVDRLVRLLAEYLFDLLLHHWDTGAAAHQDNFVYFVRREVGVLNSLLARPDYFLYQIVYQFLEFRPGQGCLQVFGPAGVGGYVHQVNRR